MLKIEKLAQKTSLRFKFFAGVLLLLFLFAVSMQVAIYLTARSIFLHSARTQGQTFAKTIASTSSYYVIFALRENLQDIVDTMALDPQVVYADFVGPGGNILSQSEVKYQPKLFQSFKKEILIGKISYTSEGQKVMLFTFPILPSNTAKAMGEIDLSSLDQIACITCHSQEGMPKLTRATLREEDKEAIQTLHKQKNIDPSEMIQEVPGYFRLAISLRGYQSAKNKMLVSGAIITLVIFLISIGLIQGGTSLIMRPLLRVQRMAQQIASGDLSQRVKEDREDELGVVAKSFNAMTDNLEDAITRIREGHNKLLQAINVIGETSEKVGSYMKTQAEHVATAIEAMERSHKGIQVINQNVENLSTSSEETSSSILEMVASMEEVTKHTDSLFSSVEQAANVTTEMVSSINQVDHNMENLASFVTETSASMMQMDATIAEVGKHAEQAYELSVLVSRAAEEGMKSVQDTIGSIQRIQDAVGNAEEVILTLGKRSEEIGKILNVIDEIAEQTNLLALNAAILAAQAGEHGKGFSVVASEIRELSERTASSTKEIAELIRNIQQEVQRAIERTKAGRDEVTVGVKLSTDSGRALEKILDSSMNAANMVKEIANATKEQAKNSQAVTKAVEQVRDMTKDITKATSEQSAGSSHILEAVDNMREMTNYVRQATQEQKSGSLMISQATERMMEMIHNILEITSSQAEDSQKVISIVQSLKTISQESQQAVQHLQEVMEQLDQQSKVLEELIARFKTRE